MKNNGRKHGSGKIALVNLRTWTKLVFQWHICHHNM